MAADDDDNQRLIDALGSARPRRAYVAPIECDDQVVALLYADNLPHDAPPPDTTALEIMLHEVGRAFGR